jgi:hypothetical protein
MSVPVESRRITKAELFGRLAGGTASGVTVVTPNRRLALAIKREFDDLQVTAGAAAWDTADILPFSAFVERAHEGALYSSQAAGLAIPVTPVQEQALWERVIRDSEVGGALLAVPETAALAREAWQLAHAWRLMPRLARVPLNEDGKAFQQWAQR